MRRCLRRSFVIAVLISAAPLSAQHAFSESGGTYDPKVPTPSSVFGYDIGDRFTPNRMVLRYSENRKCIIKGRAILFLLQVP